MANEALNKLRKALNSSYREITDMVMEIVDQAIAHAVEEATSQPAIQFAEQQARLMKAKADKAELEAEKLRLKSGLLYDPESGKLVDSEGNAVKVPSEEISIHQARQEKARADLLELQVAERRRVRPTSHFVFAIDRGDEPSRSCLTVFRVTDGHLEVVASGVDVQAEASPFGPIRDEEIAPKAPDICGGVGRPDYNVIDETEIEPGDVVEYPIGVQRWDVVCVKCWNGTKRTVGLASSQNGGVGIRVMDLPLPGNARVLRPVAKAKADTVQATDALEALASDFAAEREEERRRFRAQSLFTQCRMAEVRGFDKAKRAALEAVRKRRSACSHFCDPDYGNAMCAAIEEIEGITLNGGEG